MPVPTVRSCSEAVASYSVTSGGKRRRSSAISARSASAPIAERSQAVPPGTMQSIISRWPKATAVARSTRSRRMAQCACIRPNEASLQMAPTSPRWLASRSSSAISARSHTARGGGATSSARSTACAKP